jgi:hypothetical protein
MIDVKEAVRISSDYLRLLYEPTQLNDVLLEEVSLSDDEKHWHVTLGFSRPAFTPDPMRALIDSPLRQGKYQREYKVFHRQLRSKSSIEV